MSDIAPSGVPIQLESVQFNGPVSESSLSAIGALCNYLLQNISAVGDIAYSALDESTYQAQKGTGWVLADGRDVTGSAYQTLTSQEFIPDLRGVFIRGKNNGRADGNQNPDGDLAIGTYSPDKFASHVHGITDPMHNHNYREPGGSGGSEASGSEGLVSTPTSSSATGITINAAGGNETAGKSVTMNAYIRIN